MPMPSECGVATCLQPACLRMRALHAVLHPAVARRVRSPRRVDCSDSRLLQPQHAACAPVPLQC
eukprot:302649-Chlamydomonas_euryale.AAC.1